MVDVFLRLLYEHEIKGTFFVDPLKTGNEIEFLTSSETFFPKLTSSVQCYPNLTFLFWDFDIQICGNDKELIKFQEKRISWQSGNPSIGNQIHERKG